MKPVSLSRAVPIAVLGMAVLAILIDLPASKAQAPPTASAAAQSQPNGPVVGYWRFGQATDPGHFEIVVLNHDGEGSGFFIQPSSVLVSPLILKKLNPSMLICMWNDAATGALYAAKGNIQPNGAMRLQVQRPDGGIITSTAPALTWLPNQLPTHTGPLPGSEAAAAKHQDDEQRYSQERNEKQRQQDQWDQDRIEKQRRAEERQRAEDEARASAEERRRDREADRR